MSKVIMAVSYPVTDKNSVKFVKGFKESDNGAIEPLYTNSLTNAKRFGIEGKIHVAWLSKLSSDSETTLIYSLFEPAKAAVDLFDDGKDYSTVELVVYNTRFESHQIWKDSKAAGYTYKQDTGGNLITIGCLEERPVCIIPMIHTINGVRVLFVEVTSEVICWRKVDEWVKAKLGKGFKRITAIDELINEIACVNSAAKEKEMMDAAAA